jgi:FdhE protein
MTRPTWPTWDERIARARVLADQYPFAAEILVFYSKLAVFQKASYAYFQSIFSARPLPNGGLWHLLEPNALLQRFRPFLSMVAREAPPAVARFACDLEKQGPTAWLQLLSGLGSPACDPARREPEPSGVDTLSRFCAQAFIHPYAEYLANRAGPPELVARRSRCPFCGALPLVGVLRREGDGAKRSLLCSLCRTEWDYPRIACPACEEYREERLCVYTVQRFDCVRVEACETCRSYLKTIDLTRNGLAVPEVDDLASIPLTLWAEENGYEAIGCNFFGV